MDETSEADEEIVGTIELVESVLLISEESVVEVVTALELLRALDKFPPAACPDLVALTEDS